MDSTPKKFEIVGVYVAGELAHEVSSGIVDKAEIAAMVDRHAIGDWGDVCDEDKASNDADLANGGRVLSAYTFRDRRVWIVTVPGDPDADDEPYRIPMTTIMYADDY